MTSILNRLPDVRGSYTPNDLMARHTWFGVGGPADILFSPLDEQDLAAFLADCPDDIPLFAVGAGSNLLVRDGGVAGVVINESRARHHASNRHPATLHVSALRTQICGRAERPSAERAGWRSR